MSEALLSEPSALWRRLEMGDAVEPAVTAVGAGLAVAGVAAAAGGYFPTSWGWTALAFLWVTGLALALRKTVELGISDLVFFGALTLFAGWVWLGTTWSESAPSSFLEGQRVLVYVGGSAAALLLVRRRTVPALIGGVLTAITAFALASVAPAISVVIASRFEALTHATASVDAAAHDGRPLALVLVSAGLVSAGLTVALVRLERSVRPPEWLRMAYAGLLLALLATSVAVAVARYGGPLTITHKAYDSFIANPKLDTNNLNRRLFSFSGNGRAQLWKVAWRDVAAHPGLGSGPGTFEQEWYRHRTLDLKVRDAHNLYLEQLAELGPFGLAFLGVALAVPLVVAPRARGFRLTGAVLAAYVAFLVHAAVDWDWEVTAVTMSALLCGIAVLAAGHRPQRGEGSLVLPLRLTALAATAALGALAFVGLVGNLALASSTHAAARNDWQKSASQAKQASDWAPSSSDAVDL